MTPDGAKRLSSWLQRQLGLTDWTIRVDVQDEAPRWVKPQYRGQSGVCHWRRYDKTAEIWVSPKHCEASHYEVDVTLAHEFVHVFVADHYSDSEHDGNDVMTERLAQVMVRAWRAGTPCPRVRKSTVKTIAASGRRKAKRA